MPVEHDPFFITVLKYQLGWLGQRGWLGDHMQESTRGGILQVGLLDQAIRVG